MLFLNPVQILNTAIHEVVLDQNMRIPETTKAILKLRHAINHLEYGLDKTLKKGA